MDTNKRKEEFSRAYLLAVAARCGWSVASWNQDVFKVDQSLGKEIPAPDGTNRVLHLDFQLKCSASPTTDNAEYVSYSLDAEDYAQLSSRVGGKPMFLAYMVVPDEIDDWFELQDAFEGDVHKSTLIKFCGYIAFISDEEGNYLDAKSKTIRFKKGHHEFDEEALFSIEKKWSDKDYEIGVLKRQLQRLELSP